MNYGDERAPLEFTPTGGGGKVNRVCPHSRTGNIVGKNWFAGTCRGCGKSFNRDEALPESDAKDTIGEGSVLINKEFTAIKAESEERAEIYRQENIRLEKTGSRSDLGRVSNLKPTQYGKKFNR